MKGKCKIITDYSTNYKEKAPKVQPKKVPIHRYFPPDGSTFASKKPRPPKKKKHSRILRYLFVRCFPSPLNNQNEQQNKTEEIT